MNGPDVLGMLPDEVVRSLDYGREPVSGTLFASGAHEITLPRGDARAGFVYAHFPRLGFEVRPEK